MGLSQTKAITVITAIINSFERKSNRVKIESRLTVSNFIMERNTPLIQQGLIQDIAAEKVGLILGLIKLLEEG